MRCLMFMWELEGLDRFMPRIKALEKEGIDFVIAYSKESLTVDKIKELARVVEMHQITFNKYPSYLRWLFSRSTIFNQIDLLDFDIVFSLSGLWFQYYSGFIADRMGKPYVLFLRGDDFKAPIFQERNILSRLFRNLVYKFHCWNCDLVIPISQDLRDLAISLGIEKEKIGPVISGGINTTVFSPFGVAPHKFKVGYAGRINKEKGSEFLLKLIEDNPDIEFTLAGPLQTKFPIRKNALWLGVIPHNSMPDFINACDIIILPSLIEGFPRVILEAYACGVPVFCTPESMPQGCEVYGLVIEQDLEEWKNALLWAKVDQSWLKGQGRAARDYSLQFDLRTYAREMKAALDALQD